MLNWIVILDVDFCEYESDVECRRFSSIDNKLQSEACSNGDRERFSVGRGTGEDEVRGEKLNTQWVIWDNE